MRRSPTLASVLAVAIAAAGLPPQPAAAQSPPAPAPAAGDPSIVRITLGEGSAAEPMTLGIGKAAIIDLPRDARDVLLSNPEAADAVIRTARRAYLVGRKLGQTSAFFFDAEGRQIALLEVRIEPDVAPLNDLIRRFAPGARAQAEAVNGAFVLTGAVRDAAEADRVVQLARRYVAQTEGGEGDDKIVNLLVVEGRDQVLVKVRIVEMSRTLVKQLGVNLNYEEMINRFLPSDAFVQVATANGFSVAGRALGGLAASGGSVQTRLEPTSVSVGSGTAALTNPSLAQGAAGQFNPQLAGVGGFAFDPGNPISGTQPTTTFGPGQLETTRQVDASLDAFERAGLLRVLAEPNLTAISGEAARFLAGGEFPVPVSAEDGRVSVEFKPFGVGLAFTPMVLSSGRISLKLATEVSDLSSEGAISTGDSTVIENGRTVVVRGVTIPALQVRRAETTVEMPSGGAIVMAGLIQERTRQAIEGLPGAKDLPVFGALFRSRDFINNETELVIIVTPYIVKPADPDTLRTPADGFANASDVQALFSGRLNAAYRTPASNTEGRRLAGPIGFFLPDRRREPEAEPDRAADAGGRRSKRKAARS